MCCLCYWLGVPLHSSSYPCPECRLTADAYGDHQVGCGGNGDCIARHNAVRDVIHAAAQSAALAPSKETPGLVPGSQACSCPPCRRLVPSTILGLHLHDREFRCCLRYWLGVPLHSSSYPCPECRLDAYGDHQVGCGGNGDRIARHNAVRDVIHAAAQSAALAPSKETPGLVPGSQARPGDIFIPCWSLGHPTAFDVLVISSLQELTIAQAAQTPGQAL